jgi:hypothetical protein
MSNSNYPAGVTDNHPHFNPPRVSATAVECGADEALVVPSYWIKGELRQLCDTLGVTAGVVERLRLMIATIEAQEQEHEYECPFNGEVDLEESECARWDCPVCGNERETDNAPEERDPDEEWERRGEGR